LPASEIAIYIRRDKRKARGCSFNNDNKRLSV
jgi:hypothetical protein